MHEATPRESSSYPDGVLAWLVIGHSCPNASDVQPCWQAMVLAGEPCAVNAFVVFLLGLVSVGVLCCSVLVGVPADEPPGTCAV